MGRHLDALERAYDGPIPTELRAAAIERDKAEAAELARDALADASGEGA